MLSINPASLYPYFPYLQSDPGLWGAFSCHVSLVLFTLEQFLSFSWSFLTLMRLILKRSACYLDLPCDPERLDSSSALGAGCPLKCAGSSSRRHWLWLLQFGDAGLEHLVNVCLSGFLTINLHVTQLISSLWRHTPSLEIFCSSFNFYSLILTSLGDFLSLSFLLYLLLDINICITNIIWYIII